MTKQTKTGRGQIARAIAVALMSGSAAVAQTAIAPTNDAPNPYATVENFFKMPEGRVWGALSAVEIDKDGKSVWVGERCGANSCWDAVAKKMVDLPVILKFDESGKLVRSFATGMMVFPHGFHIDADGNLWITDGNDNLPRRPRGAAADSPLPPMPPKVIGHQVFKFSPEGTLLLTLGKAGGNQPGQPADPASFFQPNDVITNSKGDVFVAEGHGGDNARIVKFDRTGKFIKAWGSYGSGPGQMDQPHSLAWDSKGRLFVADRSNNRLVVFDQDGALLESGYEQFSRNSGIWIDKNDMLFATDSESGSVNPNRKNWKRGIRIGSLREGKNAKVIALIPDSAVDPPNTSAGEGIAVDAAGNIYGAEVGQRALKKYVKK